MRSNSQGLKFGKGITEDMKSELNIIYNHKKHPVLTTVDSFIASQILGDGHLSIRRNNPRKDGSIPMDLSFSHTAKKAGNYTLFKWEISASLGLCPWVCTLDTNPNRFGGATLKSGFSVRDQKWLDISTIDTVKLLDPFGFLLWYLDDGSLHPKRSAFLHTEAFNKDINEKIKDILNEMFGMNITVGSSHHQSKGKTYSLLNIPSESVRKLIDLNRDKIEYIPKCMLYKIDMHYRNAETRKLYNLKDLYDFPTD